MIPFLLTFDTCEETDKFEKMYIRCNKILYRYAVAILKDQGLAEDAVHDAFLRLSKNLDKIADPDCKESINYMVTIVKNVSLTMLKSGKQQIVCVDDEDVPLPSDELSPQDYLIKKENYALLYEAVKMLKDNYRSVIELRYFNDLSEAEIADILKISENNVSVRLHRAQKQLVKNLQELEVMAQ